MFDQQFFQNANKEISKVRVTVPLWGESTVIVGPPHKMESNLENLSYDDVIMDW